MTETRDHTPPRPASGRPAAPWILIADDDDVVRAFWSDVLTNAGYRTLEARTGHEAIEIILAVVPDLLILDLQMPELSGREVLRRVRRRGILRFMPVLVVLGFLEEEEPTDSEGLNVVGYLPKPLGPRDLLCAVSAALARRSGQWPHDKRIPRLSP